MTDIYKQLGEQRKEEQARGVLPEWFTTGGYQMYKSSYLYNADHFLEQQKNIASTLAKHMPKKSHSYWEQEFFNLLWEGHLQGSTPVAANTGNPERGMPVSCSGQYIGDSVGDFYSNLHETAMLTKNGFGTSAYLGDIRARGSEFAGGGKASGVAPLFDMYKQAMSDVAQGTSRRGAWAGYIPIEHGDFFELCTSLEINPEGKNVGWNISDNFINRLRNGDPDAHARYQKALSTKAKTGKGYFFFVDKVAALQPQMYKDLGLICHASNLCTEIVGASAPDLTYTCVLSSVNANKWEGIVKNESVFKSTVFLDCVASEFLMLAGDNPIFEKAVRFTEKGRMLGLGLLGWHTRLQENMIGFEEFGAHMDTMQVFGHLQQESKRASMWLAKELGEPEWCKGYGVRNTHTNALAPNMSSAVLAGQVSQSIEPWITNSFIQDTASGSMQRINPTFLKLAKAKGKYNKGLITDLNENNGSVQHLTWMNDHEKLVFKTAFEIYQGDILRLASTRQQFIDQAQSINLFFDADAPEEYIAKIHQQAFEDPNIKSLYYMRTLSGIKASMGEECVACEG